MMKMIVAATVTIASDSVRNKYTRNPEIEINSSRSVIGMKDNALLESEYTIFFKSSWNKYESVN